MSFERMRDQGAALFPKVVDIFDGGSERFLHKGENDRWRRVLSEGDSELLEVMARQRLEPECVRWLSQGRLAL